MRRTDDYSVRGRGDDYSGAWWGFDGAEVVCGLVDHSIGD